MPTGGAPAIAEGPVGPVYSVGEAARLAGISPSTIRLYEKGGLLTLRRTPGGHRYLTEDDLSNLRRIGLLRRTHRLPLAAIRQQLQKLAPPARDDSEAEPALPRLGQRIRALRTKQGRTLRDLAARTGLSTSFLSSFERGTTGISVANLQRLIGACGSSLIDVFAQASQDDRKLVRAKERPRLVLDGGAVVIEDLAVVPRQIEVQLWTVQPGASSGGAYSHSGEEAMFVIAGSLHVQLNESQSYRLETGDCLYFASADLHRWYNPESRPAQVLWVNTPPTF